MNNKYKVTAKQLKNLTCAMLKGLGLSEEDADYGVRPLHSADIRGIDTHGVARIHMYSKMVQGKRINLNAKLKVLSESSTTLYLDADNGMGIVMASRAVERCIEKAKESGVCVCSVTNSGHWGISGYYAYEIAKAGMLGLCISNSGAVMVPFNGCDQILGNSPFSMAFPGGYKYNYPIMFDYACSAVSGGKIEMAVRNGQEVPYGWLVDEQGNDTHDPHKLFSGCGLLPMAGHKGYLLSVILELMASAISGSAVGKDIGTTFDTTPGPVEGVGHFMLAIDLSRIRPIEDIRTYIDTYLDSIKKSKAKENCEILVPGELEKRIEDYRKENSFEINCAVAEECLTAAVKFGIISEGSTVDDLFDLMA